MSGPLRPTFNEGQILGAADLNAQVNYDRLAAALHERTEHIWGVAQGLVLTPTPNTTGSVPYVDIDLSPGRAVDQLGRALVVTSPLRLQVSDFTDHIANRDKTKFYPVFIQAVDIAQVGDTQPGKCNVSLTTRFEESVQVSFGNPGSELTLLDQTLPTVADGLDTANVPGLDPRVLVGWVQFDKDINSGQFIAVNTSTANNTTVHYVGVVASDVVAGGGVLTLHTRPDGQRFVLSIVEDSTGGATLAFGKQDGSNPVVPTFRVNEKGDINYDGTLTPAPIAKTLAESGYAFDGVKLPLPASVDDSDDKIRIHILVTPVPLQPKTMEVLTGSATTIVFPFVETCGVDKDRVLSSSIRWVDSSNAANYVIESTGCNYLVVASGG